MLLSSGSRLDYDLLISFRDERRAKVLDDRLESIEALSSYRIRNYEDRSERNLDTVETLTDYITLILLISSIFAFIILRSAHENFYESLSRTLRITEILGLSRVRQQKLLLMLYSVIVPTGFIAALGISYLSIILLQTIPEASEFQFFWG
jgi:predicted lysophospholipase L1 biosynthesis ABC-type transport system permease subunit